MSENQKPVVKEVIVPKTSSFDQKIEQLKTNGTQAQIQLINAIETYIIVMDPRDRISDDDGARQQYKFWKTISNIAENISGDEFRKCWNILLAYFNQYKNDVFHDRFIFRFSEFWQWSEYELNGYHRILNIIKLTADPDTRDLGLKQVSLDRSLTDGFTDLARQKIINFYKS